MVKTAMRAALVAAALTGAGMTSAFADEAATTPSWGTISGTLAVTSDYIFRGQSQNHGDPALQGSLTYTHPSGLYLGVWASNIEFATPDDHAKLETDWSIGYSNTIGKFKYDAGFVYYLYPGSLEAAHDNYYEFYGKGTYDFGVASLMGSIYGSPEFVGETGGAIYYNATVTVPLPFLPLNAALSGWGGYQTFLDDTKKLSKDYWDYSAGISFTWQGFTADFRWIGTSLPGGSFWTEDTHNGQYVFTLTKAF